MDIIGSGDPHQNVVLIADVIDEHKSNLLCSRRDLEQSDQETIDKLIAAISQLGRKVVHYRSPYELAVNASQHTNDIVLSIFGGDVSRNRMTLVPAICESFNLSFIGPDVYGRVIAQDKEVSKRLASDCGLRTPSWQVIRSAKDIDLLQKVNYPCVVKPLLEGSSIGISQENLARTPDQAIQVVTRLLSDIGPPILIEDFVSGKETALSVMEQQGKIRWAYSEVVIKGNPDFFQEYLFDAAEKMHPTPGRTVRNIDVELDQSDLIRIEHFLRSYGDFGYCRVDGRHADGKFYFLEVTPDAWIDPKGQFAMAFTEKGWSYSDVISAVLSSKS